MLRLLNVNGELIFSVLLKDAHYYDSLYFHSFSMRYSVKFHSKTNVYLLLQQAL